MITSRNVLLGSAALLCLALGLITSQDPHDGNVVALHSEWAEDEDNFFFSQDLADDSDQSDHRMLKRSGPSRGTWRKGNGIGAHASKCRGDSCGCDMTCMIVGSVVAAFLACVGCVSCHRCYKKYKATKRTSSDASTIDKQEINPSVYEINPNHNGGCNLFC